jgi:hypothetical protein
MDVYRLTFWLEDIAPRIENLDGYLFIDRFGLGHDRLREKTKGYNSLAHAQEWMNIVPLDDFLTEVLGDNWEASSQDIDKLLSIFERAWTYQVRALFPGTDLTIERLLDDEYGDICLRMRAMQATKHEP